MWFLTWKRIPPSSGWKKMN